MTWSLERIYSRCDVDEDGCRIWRGSIIKDGRYPVAQVADPSRPHGQRQVHVRRMVYEAAKGNPAPPPPRYVLVCTCEKIRCVSEDCLVVMTKGRRLRQAVERDGAFQSLPYRAAVSRGRSKHSRLSDEAVKDIRTSRKPMRELAALYGISVGYGYEVKAGRNRPDYTNPYASLMVATGRRP